jgi:serine/threonine protein kinase
VHRDIKPSNIMLTRTGAKLLDFNIASRVGEAVKTQSGTPAYQAPDAYLIRWDTSTDLFAVGVVLYELLCDGHHPYPGGKPMIGEQVINPRVFREDLLPSLAQFLVKACAPERGERFTSATSMRDELRQIRTGL